jgi:hypothetical protein
MNAEVIERYEDKIMENGMLTDMLPDTAVINGISIRIEPGDDDFQNLLIDVWTEEAVVLEDEQADDIGLAVQEYLESQGAFSELGFDDETSWFIKVANKQ